MHDSSPSLAALFNELAAELPHFDDGRINYREAKRALVLTAPVVAEGRLLLLKRSDKVGTYRGKWSVVAGYIDEPRPVEELVRQELAEELAVSAELVQRITVGPVFNRPDPALGIEWWTVPVLVQLKHMTEPNIDWEHTEYRWIDPDDLSAYDMVMGMEETVPRALRF